MELQVFKRCQGPLLATGFYLPLKTQTQLLIQYRASRQEFSIFANKKLVLKQSIESPLKHTLPLTLGSVDSQEWFYGEISALEVFDQIVEAFEPALKPNFVQLTIDNRICLSECKDGVMKQQDLNEGIELDAPINDTGVSQDIPCDARGSDANFAGPTGKKFRLNCKPNCTEGTVIGTLYYLDESAICRSAIHAGLIEASKGGTPFFS